MSPSLPGQHSSTIKVRVGKKGRKEPQVFELCHNDEIIGLDQTRRHAVTMIWLVSLDVTCSAQHLESRKTVIQTYT
jgi:hypothetical protein